MCSFSHGKERVPCSMPSGARWLPAKRPKRPSCRIATNWSALPFEGIRIFSVLQRVAVAARPRPRPGVAIWRAASRYHRGTEVEPPAPRDIRAFSAVVDGSRVHYHSTGSRGGPAFTDRGRTIDIYDTGRRESVLAALQLSAQKWGTITVRGNEQFRRTCVELAAEHGFTIANPDLQQAIATERERLRPRKPDPWSGSRVDDQRP